MINKKGSGGLFIIVLILIIALLVFIYPLGGGKDVEKITDKFNKLSCPEVNTNLTCDLGLYLYNDDRGCPVAECKKQGQIVDSGLSETGTLQVFFIDVGQGDGIYIETPDEKSIVIDTGRGSIMSDFLVFRGVEVIDWLIVTHPDADHIGGVDEILDTMVVKNYLGTDTACDTDICNALPLVLAEEEGLIVHTGYSGFELTDVDLEWTFLNPNEGLEFKDKNDESFVIKLTYGDVDILFTGDCAEDCEEMLILLDKNISADILKVGHHGSKYSTSAEFLARVNPAFAVLSYGDTNSYGHPDKSILDRLVSRNINIVRTASAGNIEFRTDSVQTQWICDKKGDCFE